MENSKNSVSHISAVIFDLDGTLLNTEQVARNIVRDFLLRYGKVQDQEKDKKRLGMMQYESAASIVRDYELPLTPEQYIQEINPMYYGLWQKAAVLPGVHRLMTHLHEHRVPFALASNSKTKNIDVKVSLHEGWKEYFRTIVGSDQVKSGKPSPDIFLEAARRMGIDPAHCLVIEDSVTGVRAGKAAGMKVVAVPSLQTETEAYSIADSILHSLLEFQPEIWGLLQFADWVDNALPVEPICLTGLLCNGLLQKHEDDGRPVLPDQVWGLFIGWVKIDGESVSKVVINIGWDIQCCRSKRKIQLCIVDGSSQSSCDKKIHVVLVGYLRRSLNTGYTLNNLDILEEDKLIASSALSLPSFSHVSCNSFFEDGVEEAFS